MRGGELFAGSIQYNYSDHVDEVASPLRVVSFCVRSMHMPSVLVSSLNPIVAFYELPILILWSGTGYSPPMYQTTKKCYISSKILLCVDRSTETLAVHSNNCFFHRLCYHSKCDRTTIEDRTPSKATSPSVRIVVGVE